MFNIQQLESMLRGLADAQLQQFAQANKNDAIKLAAATNEMQRRKSMRSTQAAPAQPPVVDQVLASNAVEPAETGIALIPTPHMPSEYADGGIVALAGGGTDNTDPVQSFATQYKPIADQVGAELDVDPGLILAQWGHETGWGKGIPGKYNLGNIKGQGASAYDKIEKSRSQYKNYNSPEEFAADYVSQMKRNWPGVIGAKQDVGAFTAGLEKGRLGKYATDEGYGKKLAKAFTKALPFSSAQAADTAPPAADISPEAGATATGAGLAALPAAAGAAYAAKEVGNPFMRSLGLLKQGTPKLLGNIPLKQVTGRMAAGAAAVPAAVGAIGADLSRGAANALSNATPEQLEQLQTDIGSDTGLAAAIMNPANRGADVTAKQMPYGEQMGNVLKFLGKAAVLHPDVTGQGKSKEVTPYAGTLRSGIEAIDKAGAAGFDQPPAVPAMPDLTRKEENQVISAAKDARPDLDDEGMTRDDWLTLGFALLSGKSQYAGENLGTAGLAMLKGRQERGKIKMEREKAERERIKTLQDIEYSKAHAKEALARAQMLEEANRPRAQYKKAVDEALVKLKASMAYQLATPAERAQMEQKERRDVAITHQDIAPTIAMSPTQSAALQRYGAP